MKTNKDFINSRKLLQITKPKGKFSLSHKNAHCVLAVCKKPIGIDMEELTKRDFESVCSFCFNKVEKEIFQKSQSDIFTFYQIFTLKEALIKKNNLGFSDLDKVGFKKIGSHAVLCDNTGKKSAYLSFIWKKFLISIVW